MGGKADAETNVKRTQRDLSMKIIAIGSIVTLILVTLFFYFDVMQGNLMHTVVAILLVAGISFLFTTVAANAIAIVGTNPVSGMTLMTLIPVSYTHLDVYKRQVFISRNDKGSNTAMIQTNSSIWSPETRAKLPSPQITYCLLYTSRAPAYG